MNLFRKIFPEKIVTYTLREVIMGKDGEKCPNCKKELVWIYDMFLRHWNINFYLCFKCKKLFGKFGKYEKKRYKK